jgi:hypothetical protein
MASINLINVNPHYDYWTSNKIEGCRFFIEIRCYHCGCLVYLAAVGSRHQALLKASKSNFAIDKDHSTP